MDVLYIREKEQIQGYSDKVWEICQRAYQPAGGFLSLRRKEDIPKRVNLLKIVPSKDNEGNHEIGACALYRFAPGKDPVNNPTAVGFKGIAYAGNKGVVPDYRECLELLVQDDITSFEGWYWVEASDAIEHYFNKHGGLLIPNVYVNKLTGHSISEENLLDDGIHYYITLGMDNPEKYKKCMFGFPSKDAYDSIMELYGTLDNFTQTTDDLYQGTITADQLPKFESEEPVPVDKIKAATWYIFHLDECCYYNELNEVPEKWISLLNQSMNYLVKYHHLIKSESIDSIMETGRELQKRLRPLTFHKIHVEPVNHIEL